MQINDIRPLQLKELEVLKELRRVCEEHDMTYFLAYGTLLGAVRHGGFIPWDNDIDTCMPYKDYVKMQQICPEALRPNYFFETRQSCPSFHATFHRLVDDETAIIYEGETKDYHHGICVDIYPLYNVPDGRIARTMQLIAAATFLLMEAESVPKNHGWLMAAISRVMLWMFRGKTRLSLKAKCHDYMARWEDKKTRQKAMLGGNITICRTRFPAEAFERSRMSFEGEEFSVPAGYETILSTYYGDYMKLPPESERDAKIKGIAVFDTERSYREYRGKAYFVKE